MNITLQQAEKVLKGNMMFSQLGFSMLVTRLKTRYTKDPSQATLQSSFDEINNFLNKFSNVMADDCKIIAKL